MAIDRGLGAAAAGAVAVQFDQTTGALFAVAAGTVDALTASFDPTITTLTDGMLLRVRAAGANATTTPTLNVDSLGAKTIVREGGAALRVGDIGAADHVCLFSYDLVDDRWELLNPAHGRVLAATTAGEGASLVGIEDSAGNFTATDVEGALAETLSDLADTASASLGDALVGGKRTETGAVARTQHDKNEEAVIYPEDFGAVGDGTDDGTALTNFINALLSTKQPGRLRADKVYGTSVALPVINKSGIVLESAGVMSSHSVGSGFEGGTIKAITGFTGTVLEVSPDTGASSRRLDDIRIAINIDGNGLANKGLLLRSVRNCDIKAYVQECATSNVELAVHPTADLGETTGLAKNSIRLTLKNQTTTGVLLRLTGQTDSNINFNNFYEVTGILNNGHGIVVENADNNLWHDVQLFRSAGGTGQGIIWQGGVDSVQRARNETFIKLSSNAPILVKGTDEFTVAATDIRIYELDKHNYATEPTISPGATAYWRDNAHTEIAFIAQDASGTTYGAGPTDIGFASELSDANADFATPTYTAPMPGKYTFCLRLTHTDGVTVADRWTFNLVTTGRTYGHNYVVHTADFNSVNFVVADAPMNAGDTAKWTITQGGGTGSFPLVADLVVNSFSGHMEDGV